MSKFGSMGRFGNQLFQYAYCRQMARRWHSRLELPDWLGRELFALPAHPLSAVALPVLEEQAEHQHPRDYRLGFDADVQNCDVRGWFQYHTSVWKPYRSQWLEWFDLKNLDVIQQLQPLTDRLLNARPRPTVIGLHLRRGDYGRGIFYVTPVTWYRTWLEENWDRFVNPLLVIATESPELVAEFARWNPITPQSCGVQLRAVPHTAYNYLARDLRQREPWQLDFFPDFWALTLANVVLMPNSTFSFAAAMLGSPRECWRSSLPAGKFVPVDPWNDFPLQNTKAEDYAHLPGIQLTHNPYWK
jgi:hypothetical protein